MQKVMKCGGTHAVKFLSNLVEKQKVRIFQWAFFNFTQNFAGLGELEFLTK